MNLFAEQLLTWFDEHGRKDLPWQENRNPYPVWVSEIMLQQTQVTTVIPYFESFMAAFPSIQALASTSLDEVLHRWTGLGYYARARNLHKAAQKVMQEHNGKLPTSQQELEALPGIGRSTAAAIIAICTDRRATILDGNVKRVLARVFAINGWPGKGATAKVLWQKAELLTPETRVADYTQAIMDLGAMICTRTRPVCHLCPLHDQCLARKRNQLDRYPASRPKKTLPLKETTLLVITWNGKVLLEQRPETGLWGALWNFPEAENITEFLNRHGLEEKTRQQLQGFRHTFTHFHLDITPLQIAVRPGSRIAEPGRNESGLRWYNPDKPDEIGLTKPVTRILKSIF